MGIVEKQATKNAVYSYMGAGLGFITVMWMSHLLTASENGVIGVLLSYAALFSQFANLGFTSVTVKFFPYFRNKEKGHHGFLFYAIIVSLIGFILCWIAFLFLQSFLIQTNQTKSPLFVTYLYYLMPLTLFTVYFNIFDSYLRATYSSVVGSLTKDFLQRIFILLALIVYSFKLVDAKVDPNLHAYIFKMFMFFYMLFTCLPTFILIFFIIKQNEWHVKPVKGFVSKELRNEMVNLSMYSILAGGASAILLYIDAIMVNQMLGEEQTGIYRIAFYFGTIILIPARSIYRITSSIVAENFKMNRINEIHKLYKQSCNGQLAIGALLFIGIVANIDNIMQLLPAAFASGKNVILILSAGYLIEMATGINQVIISNSSYYRYDAYFVSGVVGITILANYILIPVYGITGSAIATVITVFANNALRYIFLRVKFNMKPHDMNSLKLVLISIISIIPGFLLPEIHNLFLDIAVRSSIVGGIFILLILKMEAAPELNNKIRKNLKRFYINL